MTSTNADGDIVFAITVDSSENIMIGPKGDTSKTPSPMLGKVKETRIHPNGEEVSSRWTDTAFANTDAGQVRDFGSFFFKLPAGKAGVGTKWHQDRIDTAGTPGAQGAIFVDTGTDYELTGNEDVDGTSCARIKFTGKVSMNGSASINGMDMTITGKGTNVGFALFDYVAGKLVKISGSSSQDITMASSGDNPMSIPMNQKTDYELTLAK